MRCFRGRRLAAIVLTNATALVSTGVGVGSSASAVPVDGVKSASELAVGAHAAPQRRPDPPLLVQDTAGLDWQPCEGGAECATLPVPLDYAHPNRKTIEIALLRTRATDPSRRIGSLLVNPGGPGGAGRALPLTLRNEAAGGSSAEIFARFDVVGFDPRGVGASSAISCGDAIESYEKADFTPSNDNEDKALVADTRKFVRACQQRSDDLLSFVDTTSAARDMDRIRQALGEGTISYLGFSYGTQLGAVYADRFPKRVRAFVLDGAVDPKEYARGVASVRGQTESIDEAFHAFAADCGARPDCPFYSNGDPLSRFDALIESLDDQPLPVSSQPGRTITANQVVLATALVMSELPELRGLLETMLAQAQAGDGSGTATALDVAFKEPGGTRNNFAEANTAIVCLDARWPRGATGYNALITRGEAASPRFNQTFQVGQLPCAYWPVKPKVPRAPVANGAPPMLVVGSTGDPLTAYADSEAMASQLSSGVLLTRDGPGHTAYGKSPCIDNAMNAYLFDLQVPAQGTRCS
jgi:pimeloyl-ACP methyl ester carboxylesterase